MCLPSQRKVCHWPPERARSLLTEGRTAMTHQRGSIWKGAAAGLLAGFVASWTMNQVYGLWSKLQQNAQQPEQSSKKGENTDPATLVMAKKISRELFHREIPDDKIRLAEELVHYGFGTIMGGVYGAFSEQYPQVRTGFGSAFAAGLFLIADEISVPAAGLSGKPQEVPVSSHLLGFTSHMVYGWTTEAVRRGTRRILAA